MTETDHRRHVAPQLLAREQAHRRRALVGIALLIVLSTSPVFGHHLATRADTLLAGRDHLFGLCLIAAHSLLAPIHFASHLALLAGLAYAAWDRLRAWRGLAGVLARLDSRAPADDDPMAVAAWRVGIDPLRVRIVEDLPNPAFTAGFWRPNVYVSASLSDVLDPAQLESVLAHEAAHVARRDPFRLSLLRFLACMLFYVPALRRLADDLADEAEIDADDVAIRRGSPLVLASAILRLAEWNTPAPAAWPERGLPLATTASFSFQKVDLLERRIRRLVGESTPVGTHITRRSLTGAAAVLAVVFVSGVMMAHPMPLHEGAHCRHPGQFSITHLFCLGSFAPSRDLPCPHAGQ
jgi:Zn-dependent protease with chaperone function